MIYTLENMSVRVFKKVLLKLSLFWFLFSDIGSLIPYWLVYSVITCSWQCWQCRLERWLLTKHFQNSHLNFRSCVNCITKKCLRWETEFCNLVNIKVEIKWCWALDRFWRSMHGLLFHFLGKGCPKKNVVFFSKILWLS